MKKLLVMGGGKNQIPLLEAAKDLSYDIVLCDENNNAVGKSIASVFLDVDITNASYLVNICKKMSIDGAVCNTESLMEVLSTVQSTMNYIGNSSVSISRLNSKYEFRKIQEKAGIFSPRAERFGEYCSAVEYIKKSKHDMIIKPEMSSGSRGVNLMESSGDLTKELFDTCLGHSRNKMVLIEEYIDTSKSKMLEAEVFLNDGQICLMCMFRTIRDRKWSIVPQCYCSDNELPAAQEESVRQELQKVFSKVGIRWGQYNVELALFKDKLFIIEINARQGGMMLSDFVKIYSGIDLNRLLVSSAVGDYEYLNYIIHHKHERKKSILHYRILCNQEGRYKGYKIDDKIEKYCIKRYAYLDEGEYVDTRSDGGGYATLGVLDFDFNDGKICKQIEDKLTDMIDVWVD